MDLNVVSHIMKYIGEDGFPEISVLSPSIDDIITHIEELYPHFNIKAHLLDALFKLDKYAHMLGTFADDLFLYLKGTDVVYQYSASVLNEYNVDYENPPSLGHLLIYCELIHPFDIDAFKQKYPCANIVSNKENYIEFSLDIPNPEEVVSDTHKIGEYKGIINPEESMYTYLILQKRE